MRSDDLAAHACATGTTLVTPTWSTSKTWWWLMGLLHAIIALGFRPSLRSHALPTALPPPLGWWMLGEKVQFSSSIIRCSCVRDGQHAFGSLDVAAAVGGGVHRSFGWSVDLTGFDVEVLEPPYPCYSPP